MGPVELVYIAVWLLFGLIGLVRGLWKELGVTVMLFIGLLFLQMLVGPLSKYWTTLLGYFTTDPTQQKVITDMIKCCDLADCRFYQLPGRNPDLPRQRRELVFQPGYRFTEWLAPGGKRLVLLRQCGLAGRFRQSTVFAVLQQRWCKLLPPEVLSWQALVLLVVFMMILRVLK